MRDTYFWKQNCHNISNKKKSKTKTDELKNEKENYKENKFFNKKLTANFRKGAINKGLIQEPESIYIFSKQSIVPAVRWM